MTTWVSADHHFGHAAMVSKGWRPFTTMEEHDNTIIDRHNEVVNHFNDKVYMLGDVVLRHKSMGMLHELNGSKRLVRGNHDIYPTREYMGYFKEIYGVLVLEHDLILSHIPIHPSCMPHWALGNVHGHTHDKQDWYDPKYLSVSLEKTDYYPLNLADVRERLLDQQKGRT